ncbi:MAG: hypothetical protein CL402_06280 [Acidiferrobacteraceae bacterium]|nr:hypothetical protein [Acidiferrobacteraceae bacterium]
MIKTLIFFVTMLALIKTGLADSDLYPTEVVAKRWIKETQNNWQLNKGRCWGDTKNAEIRGAIKAGYELDLIEWLGSGDEDGEASKYMRLYNTAYLGLVSRMHSSGCSVIGADKAGRYTTVHSFDCGQKELLRFQALTPNDLARYRVDLGIEYMDLIESAYRSCSSHDPIPTMSLSHLIIASLRQTSAELALAVAHSTVLAWKAASQAGDNVVATLRLEQLAQQLSQLQTTTYDAFQVGLDAKDREALVSAALHRISVIEEQTRPSSRKVRDFWQHQSLMYLGSPDRAGFQTFLKPPGTDPRLGFTLKKTGELLYYAELLARMGRTKDAANVLGYLLLWEIGTEDTGLDLMRPIDARGNIITAYPIWLALVPPYQELSELMEDQHGQLNGEQYHIARTFSRNQYISGIGEQGFWNLFEQVVRK